MIKRYFALMLAGVLALGSAAGCGGGASPQTDNKTITVITKSKDTDYWHMVQAGAILAGEDLGYDVIVEGPTDESDVQGELDLITKAARTSAALVVAPNDPNILMTPIGDAHSVGIATVVIDSAVPDDSVYDAFTGTNNTSAGVTLGRYVGAKQPDAKVGIISGVHGSETHNQRVDGIIEGLEAFGCTVMDQQPADSERNQAADAAADMMAVYPEINAIVATSDEMALGAYEAVRQAGKTESIRVYGFDGSIGGMEAVIDGKLEATMAQQPIQMGYTGVELAVQLLNGEEVKRETETPYLLINKDNAEVYLNSVEEKMERAGY